VLAEELGWDCFWFTEHHFSLYGGPEPNPAVFLAAAAARTSRIHLGSAISILPLHHPIQVAEDYAMVDVVSGGRLEFGMGLGNTPSDFNVFGVPREQARERFEENAEIIAKAWSEERFSYQGKFFSFTDVPIYPRPTQQPTPPMWVAGHSPESLGWAGRHGFNIMTTAHPYPPEHYPKALEAWREGLASVGLGPTDRSCKIHLRVWIDENAERAREVAEAAILRYDNIAALSRGQKFDGSNYDFAGMLASGRNVYGTPDQCIQAIENSIRNYEFDIFSTTFNFGGIPHAEILKAMRLFAKEVMPFFKDRTLTMAPRSIGSTVRSG
jgi:alkanesulfonate monooxygenase SsuD/methylene tetrahydromethanopterin reductase-like flavin-dependent oxidoreductase (luciferase family)